MIDSKMLLAERYIAPLKSSPDLFIGVELEYPIVHMDGLATDCGIAKALMYEVLMDTAWTVVEYDEGDFPIHLQHTNGDHILFEVSYNTLEFAFAKAKTIQEVDRRLHEYVERIQSFLRQHRHELRGEGIHPCWNYNDNRPVATPRYRMLGSFLELGRSWKGCHPYTDYGAFICGNQVQFDVARGNFLRVLNAFNRIEPVKAYLFANSALEEALPGYRISRDFFWEQSMHGVFPENIGIYSRDFQTEDDYLEYMLDSAMFGIGREEGYAFFPPIRVRDYFAQKVVPSFGSSDTVFPEKEDIAYHRSYHYQELTSRGTVEFRSICTQPWERTFAPIAFHLGLLVNLEEMEMILSTSDFYRLLNQDCRELRTLFSQKDLSLDERLLISDLSHSLLDCAYRGLQKRGFQEEDYLVRDLWSDGFQTKSEQLLV